MTPLQPHSPQHTMSTKNSVPTLIAVDGSGSTGGNRFYHAQTQRIVADVLAHKSNVTIIRWDDSTTTVTRSELQTWNANCSGGCGTSPHVIASYVKATHFKGDLVLITDGETPAEYIDMVASEMPTSNPFTHVITHLIPTGGVVNQSISCPFTRSCPYEVREYDRAAGGEGRTTVEVTATELAILGHLDSIQTIDDFLAAFPTIEKVVVAATMGSVGDPRLRDTLLALKKRIQRVDAVVKGESAFAVALEAALTPGPQQDRAAALVAARALVGEYYAPIAGSEEDPDAPTWSARIARLVSMTEGALRYSFDLSGFSAAIRGDRVRRATKVRVAPVENVPVQDQEGVAAFECPILCDTESDIVLLITEGRPILEGLDLAQTNRLMDCPLNLLQMPEQVAALRERLDHPLSLRAFQAALAVSAAAPMTDSPITRRPLLAAGRSALCLGSSLAHSHATAWTLAQLFTGGKLVGNMDFWYACVMLVARTVPYLQDVIPALEGHMKWRLTNSRSSLSLSGLAEFPTTRVPLRTAVWFVLASPEAMMDSDSPDDAKRDVLRGHLSHVNALRELHALADLPDIPVHITEHVQRLNTMLGMLAWVKHDRRTLPALALALERAAVEIEPTEEVLRISFEHAPRFVPVDGCASAEQQARVVAHIQSRPSQHQATWCANPTEIRGLASMVNPSLSAGNVPLRLNWTAPTLTDTFEPCWPENYSFRTGHGPVVAICPATCRPYYQITPDTTWKDAATAVYGVSPDRTVSTNEAHGNFVVKYGVYPTCNELLLFLHNKRINRGKVAALPNSIRQFVMEVLQENAALRAELLPAEFARRFMTSRPLDIRRTMEAGFKSRSVEC